MSNNSILKKATLASLFAISAAASTAFAEIPPPFNEFPEHYADRPNVQERSVQGHASASIGASEARSSATSSDDRLAQYSGAKDVGTTARAKATAGASGSAASYILPPAY
jgi:hypothetical protein